MIGIMPKNLVPMLSYLLHYQVRSYTSTKKTLMNKGIFRYPVCACAPEVPSMVYSAERVEANYVWLACHIWRQIQGEERSCDSGFSTFQFFYLPCVKVYATQ